MNTFYEQSRLIDQLKGYIVKFLLKLGFALTPNLVFLLLILCLNWHIMWFSIMYKLFEKDLVFNSCLSKSLCTMPSSFPEIKWKILILIIYWTCFLFSIFGEPVLRTLEELLATMKLSLIDDISLEYKYRQMILIIISIILSSYLYSIICLNKAETK